MFSDTTPEAHKVSELLDREFPHVASWIEPEILPKGGTFIFGGEAKIGKSWLMGELARGLVTQQTPFEYRGFDVPEQARVLVVEQELGERGFQKRMKKLLQNEPRRVWEDYLYYVSKRPELQLDKPEGKQYFIDMIEDVKPNVLILDPISMMQGYDENSAQEIAQMFRTLEKFKRINPEQEMAVILSHHFGKPPRGQYADGFDFLSPYNFRGTSKWKDTPDTVCTVQRGKDLDTPWESWEIMMRWITRHESSPPDMTMSVNQRNDDGRVRWVKDKGNKKLTPLVEVEHKTIVMPKREEVDVKQEKFTFNPL